jgi:hypothetical protein
MVLWLALLGSTSARAQTPLNLSHDLTTHGIAGTNMVPNQLSQDAGPLLSSGVAYAMAHGIDRVIADPGAYYFLSLQTSNAHVQLGGNPTTPSVSNLTIDLQGSALIFTHPLQYGIILWNNTNLVVQNFTTDYQPLPFTQLRVVAVDTAQAQLQYTVEPGYQDPAAFNSAQPSPGTGPIAIEVHIFRNGRPGFGTRRMSAQFPFSGNRVTIVPGNGFDPTPANMAMIRTGDIAVVAVRQFNEAVAAYRCSGCTFRNITVYSAGAAIDLTHSNNTVWERVYSIPKPGTDRLISSFGFGFQANGPNNQVRLSRAIRTLDGGFALYTWATGTVESQQSPTTLTVSGSCCALGQGVTISNGSPVVFQRRSDGAILASAILISQSGSIDAYNPDHLSYTFDHALPSNLVGAVMYTTDNNQRGGNSLVERNTVQEKSCCFGMDIWGWAGSTVRGNYIHRVGFAGIGGIQSLVTTSWTTPPLVDMTFSHNVIDGAKMTPDWWLQEMGGIQMTGIGPDVNGNPDQMSVVAHQNITIADNVIADPGRAAVWLGNTLGGNVNGNLFLHPNERLELATSHPPQTNVIAPLIVDTTSSGITTSNDTIDTTSGVAFVTDSASRELAAYAPGGSIRLNAYNLGALATPTVTLTDADGVNRPMTIQSTTPHALDVQLPPDTALGGAYLTLTSGATRYFGTLFVDGQDNIPAVNGCIYEVSPSSLTVPGTATTLPMLVVTQANCSYQVLASDAFVTPEAGGTGTGTGVINVDFAANSGDAARTTTIEIAGQPFTITQAGRPVASDLGFDTPTGGTVGTALLIAGWALNRHAASGTGVDAIHLYLTPAGGATTFLGAATYGVPRTDIAALYGSQFLNSGFTFSASGLAPGTYTLLAFAHNALTNTFDAIRGETLTVIRPVPDPHIAIDTPTPDQTVTSAFEVGGWLLDAGAPTGTGVDDVKIYVQLPGAPAPGVFIGHGRLGLARADVGALYGARFNRVGFHFTITGLSPSLGDTLWVIGHDTLTNADTISLSVPFNVDAKALMSIDVPTAESAIASNTFSVSGWAIDRAIEDTSPTGTGVDNIVLYAFHNPGSGEPAIFLGYADYGHIQRPDVGEFYAPRYTPSGYVFTVDRAAVGLGTGEYNIVPIAHSTVTGTYNNLAIVRVILQ